MYIKKIEVYGFKSFADRTVINLAPGMTTIVGPNGCGKSNISDAVRWVLGEQSVKSLRGKSMEDVIFNGSKRRAPINVSEVTVVFSNEDQQIPVPFSEVSITRRLFRSGESAYLMNKQPCRLKDILDMLMDIGLGKQTYSIIEQGKIETLISARPEQRLSLLEEAAGVMKFKVRKMETLRKLESTEDNIDRLRDIIHELENRIKKLDQQGKKAARYREYEKTINEREKLLIASEWQKIQKNSGSAENDFQSLSSRIEESEMKKNALDIEYEKQKMLRLNIEREMQNIMGSISSVDLEIVEREKKYGVLKERINQFIERKSHYQKEIDRINYSISEIEEFLSSTSGHEEDYSTRSKKLEESLREISSRFNSRGESISFMETSIDEKRDELFKLANDLASTRNRKEKVQQEIEHLNKLYNRFASEKGVREKNISHLESRQENLINRAVVLDIRFRDVLEKKSYLFRKKDELEHRQQETRDELKELNDQLTSHLSRLDILVKLGGEENGSLAQRIKENENISDKLIGKLSELIEPEDGMESLLDSVLEQREGSLLIRDTYYLNTLIAELRDSGEESFSIVRVGTAPVNTTANCLPPALSGYMTLNRHIKSDYALRPFIDLYFGNIVVVPDMETLFRLKDECPRGVEIVSCDGFRADSIGNIRYGFLPREKGVFTRKKIIRELNEIIASIKEKISSVENTYSSSRTGYAHITEMLASVCAAEVSIKMESELIKTNLESVQAEIKREVSVIGLAQNEIDINRREAGQKYSVIEDVKKEIECLVKLKQDAHEDLKICEEKIKTLRNEKDETSREMANIREETIRLRENKNRIDERISMEKRKKEEFNNQISTWNKEVESIINEKEGVEHELQNIDREIKYWTLEKETRETERMKINEQLVPIDTRIAELDINYKDIQKDIDTFQNERHSIEMRKNEENMRMDYLREKAEELFKTSLEHLNLKDVSTETIDIDILKEEIKEIKAKKERLGSINFAVAEEMDECKERYTFLTRQYEDIEKARNDLLRIISEIDEKTTRLFNDTFNAINTNFNTIFNNLFNGGKAELKIINDEEKNNEIAGIEIIVHPPGKKPSSITLLSGGEKALVALTLLFSIFMVKPSPICMLDEVDAPLDETNIGRFTRLIDDFKTKTQFIVTSHNKNTMEMSDTIYGVTMAEAGVSKVMSVKLTDAEELAEPENEILEKAS